MTTYTIVFPHKEGIPIRVQRQGHVIDSPAQLEADTDYWLLEDGTMVSSVPRTYHVSLASVLRLVRLATTKPTLVTLASGCALEVLVNNH